MQIWNPWIQRETINSQKILDERVLIAFTSLPSILVEAQLHPNENSSIIIMSVHWTPTMFQTLFIVSSHLSFPTALEGRYHHDPVSQMRKLIRLSPCPGDGAALEPRRAAESFYS